MYSCLYNEGKYRMNFISKQWIVIAVAFLGIGVVVLSIWTALILPARVPQPIDFIGISLIVMMWLSAACCASLTTWWVWKHTLFYRLLQLLAQRTALLEKLTPFTVGGVSYGVARLSGTTSKHPLYAVTETSRDNSFKVRYHIEDNHIMVESYELITDSGDMKSSQEMRRVYIPSEPLKTLKLLVKALEVPVS